VARPAVFVVALVAAVVVSAVLLREDSPPQTSTATAAASAKPRAQRFHSRPDLKPPLVTVNTPARGTTDGYVLLAPKRAVAQAGPMILDDRGEVVWFRPLETMAVADFRAQRYGGRPVLTWWRGRAPRGVGAGHYVIVDESYNEIATVTAGNGLTGDIHEFLITPRDTALVTIYERKPWDLSPIGGPKEGEIFDGVIQELDIASGRVLLEWKASDHIGPDESTQKAPPAEKGEAAPPFDYFHVNSVAEDLDGNLLVSARHTNAVYKISKQDGRVLWRLGGKRSDYAMGSSTRFALQHDARRQPDGTLTLFDNGAKGKGARSRVLVLRLDDDPKRARLVRTYVHPDGLFAETQANAQFLPNGHVLVGWGQAPYVTEFDRSGEVLFDLRFGGEGADSYRAYRAEWTGRPADDPALAATRAEDGRVTAYASWNGATEVARWQLVAGPDSERLNPVATAPKAGFETKLTARTAEPFVRVRALAADGTVLGSSGAVRLAE
jgi:Arylsulfotransferase (ASST)